MEQGMDTGTGQESDWKGLSMRVDGAGGIPAWVPRDLSPHERHQAWPPAMAPQHPARRGLPIVRSPQAGHQARLAEKICVLGDSGVGKTSIIRRYAQDRFEDEYLTTSGARVTLKKIKLHYPERDLHARLTVQIWDVTGEHGGGLNPAFFRGASGALVVGDAVSLETQLDLWKWIEDFRRVAGNVPVLIVINKTDIMDRKEFDQRLVEDISREYDCIYTMTSARNNDRVNEAFGRLTDFMVRRRLIDGPEGAKAC
jgi:small GTP-binding protein